MTEFNVEFQPVGRRGKFSEGKSLLDCARELGVGLSSVCGGKGTCAKCRVRLVVGTASEPVSREEAAFSPSQREAGWRLACQTFPTSDCVVHVPLESMTTPQRTQLEGMDVPVSLKPPVKAYQVQLSPPSLSDTLGDADRLLQAIRDQWDVQVDRVDLAVMSSLSPRLREWSWKCCATVRDGEVVAVRPESGRCLGLAVDFGTTKLAAYLVDMIDGKTLASKGLMNPQISYGEDIISRCNLAVNSTEGAMQMQKLAADALTELGAALSSEVGATPEDIVEAVVVGNTAMDHLYLGLPVRQLALAPFVPAVSSSLSVKARDIGIGIAPGAYVYVMPNIAGFVGADHVSMLLATEVRQAKGTIVALDIGTNTEISLIDNGRISSVSCASGPAFEGGHIKDGMRAGTGAIERVRIVQDSVEYETIDDASPVGICGSGIIDTVAQIYLSGIADGGGRIKPGHQRVRELEGQYELVLADEEERNGSPAVVFTQHDVRELQLGKAAIRAGIQTLLDVNNVADEDITEVIVAGAFGSYLDVGSAVETGMLPALPLERFKQVGNAAGMGAKRALISIDQRDEASLIASEARYVELAGSPKFNQSFVQALQLGRYRMKDGKREDID